MTTPSPAMRRTLVWPVAGLMLVLVALAARTSADPDLWGHVRFGLDMLRAHRLPSVDPYSFTQDRPWVNHEWLSELQMGLAYAAAGVSGLAILKGALTLAAFLLVWLAFRGADFTPRLIALAAVVVGTAQIVQTLRPQLWTFLCLAILCRALVSPRPRVRLWLPLLFVLWANLHGGWIVGLGVLVVWAALDAISRPAGALPWAALVAACVTATLCTPYGLELWRFLLASVRTTRPMIEEWQPLWTLPPAKWLIWVATTAAAAWLLSRPGSDRGRTAGVLALLAFGSLRVARIAPLFVESAGILLAASIAARWPSRARARVEPSASDRAVAPALFAVGLAASLWVGSSSLRCVAVPDDPRMPDASAARLLDDAPAGRLVTFFNWGEFAIWHWGPRLRVSMDGRRETVYSDARLAEHDAILRGTSDGLALLDGWKPEYVWLPATSAATRTWLAGHGYRIEAETSRSFVAVRADLPPLRGAQPPARSNCFPG